MKLLYFSFIILLLFISLLFKIEKESIKKELDFYESNFSDIRIVKNLIHKEDLEKPGIRRDCYDHKKKKEYKCNVDRYKEIGIASYYYENDGHTPNTKTSNMQIFDSSNKITGASYFLPIPSIVKVRNIKSNKEIFVIINDRGMFRKDLRKQKRIIDLSKKAMSLLESNFEEIGLVNVSVEFDKDKTKYLHKILYKK